MGAVGYVRAIILLAEGSFVLVRRRQCAPATNTWLFGGTRLCPASSISFSLVGLRGSMCVTVSNFVKTVEPSPRYGDLTVFKMAAVHHFGF